MTSMGIQKPTWAEQLDRIVKSLLVSAGVRVGLLETRDPHRSLQELVDLECVTQSPRVDLYHFSLSARRQYHPHKRGWDEVGGPSTDPVSLLNHASTVRKGGIVVVEEGLRFLSDQGGDIRARSALEGLLLPKGHRQSLVVLFLEAPEASQHIPAKWAAQFVRLPFIYPSRQELQLLARKEWVQHAHRTKQLEDVQIVISQADRLAEELTGLTYTMARDRLREVLVTDLDNVEAAVAVLRRYKWEKLSCDLSMCVLDTATDEAPMGLENITRYLQIHRDRICRSGPERARGIVLVGPPGTGKTLIARSVGNQLGLPVVEFKIASIMSSLLGATEQRLTQALQVLESMAPNVVFIDELDKIFGQSGSERDGGTMLRSTGTLLSWLSDNPHPNFVVATANNLSRMGEIGLTMTRSERFDGMFFVDVPGYRVRYTMLIRWLEGHLDDTSGAIAHLAERSARFSGADLRSLTKRAMARSIYEGATMTMAQVSDLMDCMRPKVMALYDEFEPLRQWGRLYCEPAGLQDE